MQRSVQSEPTFPFQYIITFQKWQYLEPVFYRRFNSKQLLFKAFFSYNPYFCGILPKVKSSTTITNFIPILSSFQISPPGCAPIASICQYDVLGQNAFPWVAHIATCVASMYVILLGFLMKGTTIWLHKKFLAIFRNEITTILTLSTAKGVSGGGEGDHVFCFGGPWLQNPQC